MTTIRRRTAAGDLAAMKRTYAKHQRELRARLAKGEDIICGGHDIFEHDSIEAARACAKAGTGGHLIDDADAEGVDAD
jgi:hypothetical protein